VSYRIKKRLREIEFYNIERIKKGLKLSWEQIEIFLDCSESQRKRYKASGALPAFRYYSFEKALLLRAEEKARKERQLIISLFKGYYDERD
jgi:hypothetical protein